MRVVDEEAIGVAGGVQRRGSADDEDARAATRGGIEHPTGETRDGGLLTWWQAGGEHRGVDLGEHGIDRPTVGDVEGPGSTPRSIRFRTRAPGEGEDGMAAAEGLGDGGTAGHPGGAEHGDSHDGVISFCGTRGDGVGRIGEGS